MNTESNNKSSDSVSFRRLQELEGVIEKGLHTFVEVGQALLEIRESRLYRQEGHKTFEDYCQERWSWSHRHANRQIEAAQVVQTLGPAGPKPETERQVRELAGLKPEQQREVWSRAVRESRSGQPSAPKIREVKIRSLIDKPNQEVEMELVKQALDRKQAERHRRLLFEELMKIADGKLYSDQQICEMTGRKNFEWFLRSIQMLPWLTIERAPGGYRFLVDEELRLICEDRAPRPQLNSASVHAFIKRLAKEIDRKRKENNERRKGRMWNPDITLKGEQKLLLDWIEMELLKLIELMASSGSDYSMSAIRTQNHPDKDKGRDYVF